MSLGGSGTPAQAQAENPPAGDPPNDPPQLLLDDDDQDQPIRADGAQLDIPPNQDSPNNQGQTSAADDQQGSLQSGSGSGDGTPGAAYVQQQQQSKASRQDNQLMNMAPADKRNNGEINEPSALNKLPLINTATRVNGNLEIPLLKCIRIGGPPLKRPSDNYTDAAPDKKRRPQLPFFGSGANPNPNPYPVDEKSEGSNDLRAASKVQGNAGFHNSDPENISIRPSPEEINEQVENGGVYNVEDLCIRHKEHGGVVFLGSRDLRKLGSNTDLGKLVNFQHGRITIQGSIGRGMTYFSLLNITQDDISKQIGLEGQQINDQEMFMILNAMGVLLRAVYWTYNRNEKKWSFLIDDFFPAEIDVIRENGGDPESEKETSLVEDDKKDDDDNPNMDIFI